MVREEREGESEGGERASEREIVREIKREREIYIGRDGERKEGGGGERVSECVSE